MTRGRAYLAAGGLHVSENDAPSCGIRHGWEFFEKLAQINVGECLVGVGAVNNVYGSIDKGNPIGVVHPSDGLVLCVTPSGIPASPPHPNAGKLLMEWLLSPQYARMIAADGSEPILKGISPRRGVPEVIEQWRDSFGS